MPVLARAARSSGSVIRDRLSPDAWQVITEMSERLAWEIDDDGVVSTAELILRDLASFAGLAQENMNRAAGWRFLDMGRRAERAINTTRFARQFAYDDATSDDLDVLLTLARRAAVNRSRKTVAQCHQPMEFIIMEHTKELLSVPRASLVPSRFRGRRRVSASPIR